MRAVFLVYFGLLSLVGTSQEFNMKVSGTVRDILSRQALGVYSVSAYDVDDTTHSVSGRLLLDGGYELWLLEQRSYMIVFNAPGHVEKRALMELGSLKGKHWSGGYGVPLDILLFREVPGLDLTFNGEAFGINRYNARKKKFEWDMDHLAAMNERQAGLMETYERQLALLDGPAIIPAPGN